MNVNIPAYLLFIFCSSVLCCLLFMLSAVKTLKLPAGKAGALSGLVLVLGAVLGLAGAKLLYFLFRFSYILKTGFFSYLFSLNQNELSYYGGAAGVCLAVVLAARMMKIKPVKALNAFAVSGALLAALFRFAEYWLGSLGTGDYLEQGLPFPFAVSEVWNPDFPEYYMAIFMLEGIIYLRIALFAFRNRKDRLCFLRTVFYLCIAQIILESMRAQSIRWLFVRYEQLLCYLIAEGILIWYALAGKKAGKKNWSAALWGLAVCGLTVLAEYMLDGKISFGESDLPPVVIYACVAWILLELTAAEHAARKKLPGVTEAKA